MDRHIPRAGEKYIHFEHKPYQILCTACDFKTREKMVVYQALYGEFECFVMPLEMFMSEVDHENYPRAEQKYCFEYVERIPEPQKKGSGFAASSEESDGINAKEEQANPVLLEFLDADTLEQKYQILKSLRNSITDRLIDDFAVVLDLVIPDGDTDLRFQQLLNSVRTMQHYESNRFQR